MSTPETRQYIANELDALAIEARASSARQAEANSPALELHYRLIAEEYERKAAEFREHASTPEIAAARMAPRSHCRTCDLTICSLSADDPCRGCCECSGGICLDIIEAAVKATETTMAKLAARSPEERHEDSQYGQSDAERIALAVLRAADGVTPVAPATEDPAPRVWQEGDDPGNDRLLLAETITYVTRTQNCSPSTVQRNIRVGWAKACRLVDLMETWGVVGASGGVAARAVLVSAEQGKGLVAHLSEVPARGDEST